MGIFLSIMVGSLGLLALVVLVSEMFNTIRYNGEILNTQSRLEIKHYQVRNKRYSSYQTVYEMIVIDEYGDIRLVTFNERDYFLWVERIDEKEHINFRLGQSKKLKKKIVKEIKEE